MCLSVSTRSDTDGTMSGRRATQTIVEARLLVLSAAKQAAYKALNDDVLAAYTCGATESLAGAALRVRSRCDLDIYYLPYPRKL
eukprot:COSAG01_NODE_7329_length_3249_cov_3.335873_2_plen_84_part_00